MSLRVGHYIPCYRQPVRQLLSQVANEARVLAVLGIDYIESDDAIGNVVIARNQALKAALDAELDYLVMQDSDVYCPSEDGAIRRLLETAGKNGATMVAAICGLRQDPPRPSVEPAHLGEVYRGHRAGTGLVLIDVHRVREWGLDGAWFMDLYSADGLRKECGQDIYFSRLIEKHGGELWVDGRIPTVHVQEDSTSLFYPGTDATAGGKSQAERTAEAG
jgi:hypothetical protein